MKTSRQDKLEAQLVATELELVDLLRQSLAHTAVHGDPLFCNSQYLPKGMRADWASPASERLLTLAQEAMALREQLGLPMQGSAGQLYLAACIEAGDTSNEHRRGSRALSLALLAQLGPGLGSGRTRW